MRLFLDANVLFTAAHNPKGKAALVIELGIQGYWEVYSSPYALEESRRNLERKSPQALDDLHKIQQSLRLIEHRPDLVFPEGFSQKDQPIFQAAIACQASHLLTGDHKDFSPFMNQPDNTFGICIQSVADYLSARVRLKSRA